MEIVKLNKQVPSHLLGELSKAQGERAFLSYGASGLEAYIVLSEITKSELKEFKGSLTVIYQDYEVPFVILKYKNMSFDMPIFPKEGVPEVGNHLKIFAIELNGYIAKGIRGVGIDMDLMSKITDGINFVSLLSLEQIGSMVQTQVYPKYSQEDMVKGGTRQVFRRV